MSMLHLHGGVVFRAGFELQLAPLDRDMHAGKVVFRHIDSCEHLNHFKAVYLAAEIRHPGFRFRRSFAIFFIFFTHHLSSIFFFFFGKRERKGRGV